MLEHEAERWLTIQQNLGKAPNTLLAYRRSLECYGSFCMEYVVLNLATQENWKNDKGEYETRTEWHRVYAWRNLSKFARTLLKGQLITLEGTLWYREVVEDVGGATYKHRLGEIHATSMKRLSKLEATDDPADGAGE